jgi:hypothetical protein
MPVAYRPQLATTEGSQGNQVPSKAIDKSIDSSSHAQTCCKKGCRLPAHSLQRCAAKEVSRRLVDVREELCTPYRRGHPPIRRGFHWSDVLGQRENEFGDVSSSCAEQFLVRIVVAWWLWLSSVFGRKKNFRFQEIFRLFFSTDFRI